ncbi:hypothetical protein GOB07_30230 [Sinorhizobium meliloti]|nr:hypothetical protein [Sinorhizobium meliloti]MDX0116331.1 hypothetical protein [Sinorhizobium meliloti]MDX0378333.1 hypothetical protein [Sinorhizobium meliloti]
MTNQHRFTHVYAWSAFAIACFAIVMIAAIQASGDSAPFDGYAQWWMALVSAVGALISLWAVLLVRRQMEATTEALNVARNTFAATVQNSERELRAYVCVEECYLRLLPNKLPPNLCIDIKNCGTTPAYDVRIRNRWGWQEADKLGEVGHGKAFPHLLCGVLGPGQIASKFVAPFPEIWEECVLKMRKGSLAVFITGEISYRDAFGHSRTTRFRFFLPTLEAINEKGKVTGSAELHFLTCEHGNSAD